MRVSRLWKLFLLLLGVSLAATLPAPRPALAQSGLEVFEKDIKPQLQFKSFTYGKASAIGAKGFALENVVAVIPAEATGTQDTTIKIVKVTVDEADFERLRASSSSDDLPRYAKLRIEGMTGDDALNGMFESFGVPQAPVDLVLDYRLDPASKVLTLSTLELALKGQGSLSLSMVLEGVSDKASETSGAKDNTRLRVATLDYADSGLLAQLLPAVAKQQGLPVDAMVAMATAPIGAFAAGKSAETVKALDALASFVADWKKPQGPLRISVKPSKSASFADFDKIEEPNALSDIFGLRIEYAGTRVGATGAPAAGPTGDSAAAGKTLTGGEAWLTIVGNTITGRVDGEEIFEHYRKDGTLALMEGSAITKGKWSLEGERICFKYPDEDKDCQSVSRTGDEVTFARKGG
ncbi:MAG: hypothetical protein LCH95_20725, partial [Proteobacteria bacterium]|nr:hypothetical protein [Pseudomonadota bacterium]